ncbi:10236_t:CDS:2 [Ambispora gerdemannii]|uniref:10236_t:CDS:1 n=1 Tax=Ambispora gerdemannii TaxID=144530 RepID=A0A9N8ZDN1_9GLOM|nr:10236_t:CDS:2 [Ambispora gerdemannii]
MSDISTFFINFINQAPDRTISFAIYQDSPTLPAGFQVVAWLQADVPPDGESIVMFNRGEYNVAVVDYYDETGVGIYKSSQIFVAKIGQIWELTEKSSREANLAIGESHKIAIVHNKVKKGDRTTFQLPNQYHVGIFYDLVLGQGISSDIYHLSKLLDLSADTNHYIVTAKFDSITSKLSLEIEPGKPMINNAENNRNEKDSKL